jgi:hypothetical protein
MKPRLTEEQKLISEQQIRQIISEAPKEVQDMWDGNIYWSPTDDPMFEGNIQSKLTGRLADRFNTLLNKVKDRRI